MALKWLALACTLVLAATSASADDLLPQLREQVTMVALPGRQPVDLEVTFYRPPGEGPFPLILINHGQAAGTAETAHLQPRSRAVYPAREFVQRGYAVVIPMRRGFSRSGGSWIQTGCDLESYGHRHAEDIDAVLTEVARWSDIDASRVVVMGQSAGGLATMAFGTLNRPNVVGLINFSGGLIGPTGCGDPQHALASAMARYAARTSMPSLWFYGDNDSLFPPRVWQNMHAQYSRYSGRARLVAIGRFGTDAHDLFASSAGVAVWLPEVRRFFGELGLPFEKKFSIGLLSHHAPLPPPSGYARIDDAAAMPHVGEAARKAYPEFLRADAPRALAIAPNGAWASSTNNPTAMRTALERCSAFAGSRSCKLYAVDDRVVWPRE